VIGTALILAATLATSPVAPASPAPVAYVPAVAASTHVERLATVTGRLVGLPASWPMVTVWLAAYWPLTPDGQSGKWVLYPATAPQAIVGDDGAFAIEGVSAGHYCIIVGPEPALSYAVGVDGWARVYVVRERGVLDVGVVGLW
jgi:hypothetical protein